MSSEILFYLFSESYILCFLLCCSILSFLSSNADCTYNGLDAIFPVSNNFLLEEWYMWHITDYTHLSNCLAIHSKSSIRGSIIYYQLASDHFFSNRQPQKPRAVPLASQLRGGSESAFQSFYTGSPGNWRGDYGLFYYYITFSLVFIILKIG